MSSNNRKRATKTKKQAPRTIQNTAFVRPNPILVIKSEEDADVKPNIVPILPTGAKIVKSMRVLDPNKLRMLGLDTKILNAVSRHDGKCCIY